VLISNLEVVAGYTIEKHLGLVQGSTYTELLHQARQEATSRMEEQASAVGANAVLNVRFSTSSVAQGAAELFVYGTAVVLRQDENE